MFPATHHFTYDEPSSAFTKQSRTSELNGTLIFPAYGPLLLPRPARAGRYPCLCLVREYLVSVVDPRTRLSEGLIKEPRAAVTDIAHVCLLLGGHHNVIQNRGEREVIQGIDVDINHALAHKKPGLACAFLHHYLNSVHYMKQAVR